MTSNGSGKYNNASFQIARLFRKTRAPSTARRRNGSLSNGERSPMAKFRSREFSQ